VWRASEQFALGEKESRHHYHHSPPSSSSFLSTMLCVCVEWQPAKNAAHQFFELEKLCFVGWSSNAQTVFIPPGFTIFHFFFFFFFFFLFLCGKEKISVWVFLLLFYIFSCCPSRFNDRTM
jgi:hypothetical protein